MILWGSLFPSVPHAWSQAQGGSLTWVTGFKGQGADPRRRGKPFSSGLFWLQVLVPAHHRPLLTSNHYMLCPRAPNPDLILEENPASWLPPKVWPCLLWCGKTEDEGGIVKTTDRKFTKLSGSGDNLVGRACCTNKRISCLSLYLSIQKAGHGGARL